MNDNDKAMDAVIADMGNAVTAFKVKKYQPKPPPVAEAPAEEAQDDGGMPSMDELAAMIGE